MQKEQLQILVLPLQKQINNFFMVNLRASLQKLMVKQAQLMELLNLNYIRLYQFVKIPDYYIIVTKK